MSIKKKDEVPETKKDDTPETEVTPIFTPTPVVRAAPVKKGPVVWEEPFPAEGTVTVKFLNEVILNGQTYRKGDTHTLSAKTCHALARHIIGAH